jgi:hypothetical protein
MDVVILIPHDIPEAVPLLRSRQDGVLLVKLVWISGNEKNYKLITKYGKGFDQSVARLNSQEQRKLCLRRSDRRANRLAG